MKKISIAPGLIFLAWISALGQEAFLPLAFDAASIKPSRPGDMRGATFSFTPGGGLAVTNGTLKGMLETAYDVRDFQIAGGPGWLDSEHYDLTAKSAPGDSGIPATRRKLQALLAERFQLRVHRETKELPEYLLTVGKNGSKLAEGDASKPHAGIQRSCGQMIGTRASMADLTLMLSRQLDRPVVDRTGLAGIYDFRFNWTPDAGPCAATTESAGLSDGPSLFTAIQEQLGLRLESAKGPVDVIVVDQAEKATDN